jgi:hypothetical protein
MRGQLLKAGIKEGSALFSYYGGSDIYLTNALGGDKLFFTCVTDDRKVYETFDKDVFLKACGIKVKKDKRTTMFKNALKIIKALDNDNCNITYIGTESGYAINAQGDTELDGSFTITITGNKSK